MRDHIGLVTWDFKNILEQVFFRVPPLLPLNLYFTAVEAFNANNNAVLGFASLLILGYYHIALNLIIIANILLDSLTCVLLSYF